MSNNSNEPSAQVSDSLPAVLISLKSDPSRHRIFRPGQPLTSEGVLPNQIMLLLEGQARLLSREGDRPATLRKLVAGDVVGLASLISAAPCEIVHASTTVKAAVLPDQELLLQLEKTKEFRDWCTEHLWEAEVARLLEPLRSRSAEDLPPMAVQLESLHDQASLIKPDPRSVEQAMNSGQRIFVASANSDLALGTELSNGSLAACTPRPPLPLRLIAFPTAILVTRRSRHSDCRTRASWVGS